VGSLAGPRAGDRQKVVIPAQAGIQIGRKGNGWLDPGLRRDDDQGSADGHTYTIVGRTKFIATYP